MSATSTQKPKTGTEIGFDSNGEPQVAVDGFGQVLEMLRIADPAFRESLLKRLANKDRTLAANLRIRLNREL